MAFPVSRLPVDLLPSPVFTAVKAIVNPAKVYAKKQSTFFRPRDSSACPPLPVCGTADSSTCHAPSHDEEARVKSGRRRREGERVEADRVDEEHPSTMTDCVRAQTTAE